MENDLLFETERALERRRIPTKLELRLVPHLAAIDAENPLVCDIEKFLTGSGFPAVVGWYTQARFMQKTRSQARRVAKMQAEYEAQAQRLRLEAATANLPDSNPRKVVVYPHWISGGSTESLNRMARLAGIKVGEAKRKQREKKHARVMADRARRGKATA